MDKFSHRVLKYIRKNSPVVSHQEITNKFGSCAKESIAYLEKSGYIRSGKRVIGVGENMKPVFGSDGNYAITSEGMSYLESTPGAKLDKWVTRVVAIIGAMTGIGALVLELVLHFL